MKALPLRAELKIMDEEFLQAMETHARRSQKLSAGPDSLVYVVAEAVLVLAAQVRALQEEALS